MDPKWKERIARHGYGIDVATASEEDLEEYMETKIYEYTYENFTDYTLWSLFQEEFEGFTIEDFRKIRSVTRAKLRTHLLQRGVYVATHSNRVTISERLFEVIQREEQHQWTDEDIKTTIKELAEPLITVALRDRLNHTRDGLSGQPTAIVAIPPSPPARYLYPGTARDRLNHTL